MNPLLRSLSLLRSLPLSRSLPLVRGLGLFVASLLILSPLSCDPKSKDKSEDDGVEKGDDDDDDDDDKGKKKKRGDETKPAKDLAGGGNNGSTAPPAPAGAAIGVVLDYMPADCPKGRGYLNAGALLSDAEAQTVLRNITTKILGKERDPEFQKAITVLKDSGFDLATGIREAAVCAAAGSDDPAIGISLSVADPLGLLQKIAASLGEAELPVTTQGTAKILTSDDVTFVQPVDGVLVFGPKLDVASVLAKGGSTGFAMAKGQVGYLAMIIDAQGSTMDAKITRAGANFNLWGSLKTADLAKQDPKKVEEESRKQLLQMSAKEIKGTPFAFIDQRLETATLQVKDGAVVMTMSIPTGDVTSLLKAAAPQVGVDLSGGPQAAPNGGGNAAEDPLDELLRMMKKK